MGKFRKSISAMVLMLVVEPGVAALACEPPAGQVRQFSKEVGALPGLNETDGFMDVEEYRKRITTLKNALKTHKMNPYETAIIYQFLGSSLYEINDYGGAIEAFENAISSCGLLPNEASNLRINIAQLLIANGKPGEGAQMLEDWAEDGGVLRSKHIEYLWQAWSQAEQYDRALPWAEKWFESANPKQRKHYDLLYFLYRELEMQGNSATIIKQMYAHWPDDKSISDAHYVLNNGKNKIFAD